MSPNFCVSEHGQEETVTLQSASCCCTTGGVASTVKYLLICQNVNKSKYVKMPVFVVGIHYRGVFAEHWTKTLNFVLINAWPTHLPDCRSVTCLFSVDVHLHCQNWVGINETVGSFKRGM